MTRDGAAEASEPLRDGLARSAARRGLGDAARGEQLSGGRILDTLGGPLGVVEAVLPGIVFITVYTLTQEVLPSVVAPAVLGLLFVALRLVRRAPVASAAGGLAGVAVSAVLALVTGRGEDFFVFGFVVNAAWAAVFIASAVVRWPLLGVAVGFLMNEGTSWRTDAVKRRALSWLTVAFGGLFLLRLVVQLPLYFAGEVAALGAAKLAMGLPLYVPLLVVAWLVVRAVYAGRGAETAPASTTAP